MLKITVHADEQGTKLEVEGRLAGPWVQELDRCWQETTAAGHSRVVVDLTGVTFVDPQGKSLLVQMRQHGAELRATGCLMRCIVEEIAKEKG